MNLSDKELRKNDNYMIGRVNGRVVTIVGPEVINQEDYVVKRTESYVSCTSDVVEYEVVDIIPRKELRKLLNEAWRLGKLCRHQVGDINRPNPPLYEGRRYRDVTKIIKNAKEGAKPKGRNNST